MVGVDERRLERQPMNIYKKYKHRIVLHYRVSDAELLHEYVSSDLFISLSTSEGYGIPVADAIGFGIDVVLRDIDVYRELTKTGVGGLSRCSFVQDWRGCAKSIAEKVSSRKREGDKGPIDSSVNLRQKRYEAHLADSERVVLSELCSLVCGEK